VIRLKEGTKDDPRLLDIDAYWKYVVPFTKNDPVFDELMEYEITEFFEGCLPESCKNKKEAANKWYHEVKDIGFQHRGFCYDGWILSGFRKHYDNPNHINHFRIPGSCHWSARFMTYILNKAFPDQNWRTINRAHHSYSINKNKTIIVDILAKPYGFVFGNDVVNFSIGRQPKKLIDNFIDVSCENRARLNPERIKNIVGLKTCYPNLTIKEISFMTGVGKRRISRILKGQM